VSISTVSVVLNGVAGARVGPRTRERIRAIADRLGYAPNQLAAGLRRQSSGMVGFLGDTVATTPYAVRMVLGAQETLRKAGLPLVLIDTGAVPVLEARAL
jgi:LacI family transcriptional regulator